eukprot:6947193-Ditylum_brightwellii.AAC.1
MLMIGNIKQNINESITIKKSIAEQEILNERPNARDENSRVGVDERKVVPVRQIGAHSECAAALTAHRKLDARHTLTSIPR